MRIKVAMPTRQELFWHSVPNDETITQIHSLVSHER